MWHCYWLAVSKVFEQRYEVEAQKNENLSAKSLNPWSLKEYS
jgi:hypothetical protein